MAKVQHRPSSVAKDAQKFRVRFPRRLTPIPHLRLILVWGVLIAATLGLGIKIYRLQMVKADDLEEKARQQQMIYLRPYIPRRPIVDRAGNILATDQLVYTLYAHPKLFKVTQQEMAKLIAPLIEQNEEELVETFAKQESGIHLAHKLSEDVAQRLQDLNVDGIELIQEYDRLYPQQGTVANVIGYVDVYDHKGQAGIEHSQEKYLEQHPPIFRLSRAGNGALMPDHLPEGFTQFDDSRLQLTLDLRVQRAANLALRKQLVEYRAKRGVVIVMDVHDGSLLALASEPTYDPNRYYEADVALFKNWAVSDLYEPGSTFKPINVAIALEEGVIQPEDRINDPGQIYIDRWPISNHDFHSKGGHGVIDIAQILQTSSNIGMIKIMQRLSPAVYYDWLQRLGLGEKIGLDLGGEGKGQIKSRQQFVSSAIEPATTAFGQGFSLTPIQLAQLHAALGNGGKLVKPQIVKGLVNPDGYLHTEFPHPHPKPLFSPQTSQTVLEMMETVVTKGSGKPAQIEGYRIAGKTGTAQKASPNGGYLPNAKITSFVGIFPVDAPRYVVVAVVDEPRKANSFGSTVAAPVVKSVMDTLISIMEIPPSESPSSEGSSQD
jgi:cell division protein FtsI (penicillin-binding protein 3)